MKRNKKIEEIIWSTKLAERKKERKLEFIDPISSNLNLLSGDRSIPTKTIESFDGTYMQYDSYYNTYFKILLTKNILRKWKNILFI